MREGVDEEEEEPAQDEPQPMHERFDQDADGDAGQFVQQAKNMLKDNEEANEQPREEEHTGPKIKMNRGLGGKRKKAAAANPNTQEAAYQKDLGVNRAAPQKASGISAQGFTEEDIEFMKKAIQILCQSTNPLGKSIDFVTDDVDSM